MSALTVSYYKYWAAPLGRHLPQVCWCS